MAPSYYCAKTGILPEIANLRVHQAIIESRIGFVIASGFSEFACICIFHGNSRQIGFSFYLTFN
jgi:hypothetical protein